MAAGPHCPGPSCQLLHRQRDVGVFPKEPTDSVTHRVFSYEVASLVRFLALYFYSVNIGGFFHENNE